LGFHGSSQLYVHSEAGGAMLPIDLSFVEPRLQPLPKVFVESPRPTVAKRSVQRRGHSIGGYLPYRLERFWGVAHLGSSAAEERSICCRCSTGVERLRIGASAAVELSICGRCSTGAERWRSGATFSEGKTAEAVLAEAAPEGGGARLMPQSHLRPRPAPPACSPPPPPALEFVQPPPQPQLVNGEVMVDLGILLKSLPCLKQFIRQRHHCPSDAGSLRQYPAPPICSPPLAPMFQGLQHSPQPQPQPADDGVIAGLGILLTLLPSESKRSVRSMPRGFIFCGGTPSLSIREYLMRLYTFFLCSEGSFVVALIYILRVAARNPHISINRLTCYKLLATALVLAVKFVEDDVFHNTYYCKVIGVDLQRLNTMEVEMLTVLDWKLQVGVQEYGAFRDLLHSVAVQSSLVRRALEVEAGSKQSSADCRASGKFS